MYIDDNNINLFKPLLFELFPNMNEIIIIAEGNYTFNIYNLLSIIDSAILPKTFDRIIIKDPTGDWFESVFSDEMRCKFVESNFFVELRKQELIICKTK